MARASDLPRIRPLVAGDAPACDAVIASLPYHFGNEDGQRECAEAVRSQAGLTAVEGDRVVGFLTVVHHFPETSEITWMAVHVDHRGRGVGRALIRQLTGQLRGQGRRLLLVLTVSSLDEEPGSTTATTGPGPSTARWGSCRPGSCPTCGRATRPSCWRCPSRGCRGTGRTRGGWRRRRR